MGTGYTTILYDAPAVEDGLGDIAACRYDGAEIGLGKVRANGAEAIASWLDEYDLQLYLVMSEWIEDEAAVERIAEAAPTVAELDAQFLGLLPPQRHRHDDETVEHWFGTICDAAADAGVKPLVHHHGATHVEQPDEIAEILNVSKNLGLLFDTAHYYPYGDNFPAGDVTDGIERFADDIAYVHLKDVAPTTDFDENATALSAGDFHLDNVINYFRSFTDLGEGVIDFQRVSDALDAEGFDGHYTIEIENRTELPLVHAKENYDFWQSIRGR